MKPSPVSVTLSVLALAAAAGPAVAQSQPEMPKAPPSVFKQVIPSPTGRNGYEELVFAAETFQKSPFYAVVEKGALTLARKREVLADPQVARALNLLDRGLAKQVLSPRQELNLSTMLPELSLFRGLARLLALQQYVQLADGRTGAAVATFRKGMRFAQAVQTDTLISGLVSVAMGGVLIEPLGRRLDQLSAADCEQLYRVYQEYFAQPDPAARAILAERNATRGMLAEIKTEWLKSGVPGVAKLLGLNEQDSRSVAALLPRDPEAVDGIMAEVESRLHGYADRVLAELQKAPWERKGVEPEQRNDFAGHAVGMLAPSYNSVIRAYDRDQARIRVLATHCAIRRYRWEHGHLPASLAVLQNPEMTTDPFNGQPLQYAIRGNRFTLYSVGAETNGDDPRAVNGRAPIALTPDD